VVLLLALIKVAAGLVAFFWTAGHHPLLPGPSPPRPTAPPAVAAGEAPAAAPGGAASSAEADDFPYLFYLLFLLSFGGAAVPLLVGSRDDSRAVALAGFLLTVAAAYANGPLRAMADRVDPPVEDFLLGLEALKLQAFLAFFLWKFAVEFPDVPLPVRARRLARWGIRLSFGVGLALVLANLVLSSGLLEILPAWILEPLDALAPKMGSGIFYSLIFVLFTGALALLVWKAWRATGADARRVQLLVGALALGLAPALCEVLAELFLPGYSELLQGDRDRQLRVRWLASIPAWLTPCAIAWTVVVHHALGLRLIARRALQYALARFSTFVLAAVPVVVLCVSLYSQRQRTLVDLLSGSRLLLLVSATALGVAALRYRTRLLDAVDRRFFREQFDARQILTLVIQRLRSTHGAEKIADLLCRGIDQALHLQGIAVLLEDPRTGLLVDPRQRTRRLDTSSPLAQLVSSAADPLPVDLANPRSAAARLPEPDRAWLAEAGFQLLVPLVARDGSLLGLAGLGPKRSGLPFLREDRKLLYDIASSAALGLELELRGGPPAMFGAGGAGGPGIDDEPASTAPYGPPAAAADNAKECPFCGTLYLPYTVLCSRDSRRLEPALVPYVLPGKFRFERRIGAGGMGVVYRGSDLALGRPVAVKTLRRVSPDDALRLRREARTAASVSHPHLAAVYEVETWQGTPMLVMELMEGGTLAQRIEKAPLGQEETVELGIILAAALEHLHGADILHRDIKPSNIGYSRDGSPKLMDFGIARLMLDLRQEGGTGSSAETADDRTPILPSSLWDRSPTSITRSRQLVGTLSYLCPEALDGEPADVTFDLWSLCLVLYECLLGRKIFIGADAKQVMTRIRNGRVPDFEQALPAGDPALGSFFREALHRTLARRPSSARELRARLEAVRARLARRRAG
jgi:hypothetical protein